MDLTLYTDGNHLVSNAMVVPPGRLRASDNGVLFSSEALLLGADASYVDSINKCIDAKGFVHRAPDDTSQDAPDDYIGALSAACQGHPISSISLPLLLLQPVILYLHMVAHSNPLKSILAPLVAGILGFSNIGESKSDTSNKLLTWTIFKGLEGHSMLCKLAHAFWYHRMCSIYGTTKAIASIYFGPEHPFVLNWKE